MFRIITEGKNFREHVFLKDGHGLLLRPAELNDKDLIKSFLSRVSLESIRMRFMASMSEVPESIINELCNSNFKDTGCLLAILDDEIPKVIGLGNYLGLGNGRTAEVAFLIEDKWQGKGISPLLLEKLAGFAAANGYIEFEAEVLPDNIPMINVFKHSGFEYHQAWSSDVVHVEFPVEGAAAVWERAGLREKVAAANSLKPLLSPKNIAVAGASRDINSFGNLIFRNILNGNFSGKVFPVNPQADSINEVKAYASFDEIPETIDLAVIAVPAENVYEVAEKSIAKGARGLLVVTAGFAEAGEEGKLRQRKLVELVRSKGVRLIGPSCLGIMNSQSSIQLNASLAPQIINRGKIGFFSHSAALGLVILEYTKELGLGFSSFVSAGNRADVSGNDLLQFWEEDPETELAILYLETFGNPRKFVRIARRMSYKKPILCVKSAKSKAGQSAIKQKSGTDVAAGMEIEALFTQTGIILADTLEELFDVALVLANQPLPSGSGTAIIANSAGMTTLFADSAESNGLEIIESAVINLGAFTKPINYEESVYNCLTNENVHSLLVGFAGVGYTNPDEIAAAIKRGMIKAEDETGKKKPILLNFMGTAGSIHLISDSENESDGRQFPSFRFPESAAKALGNIVKYVQFLENPPGKLVWFADVEAETARKTVHNALSETAENEIIEINFEISKAILENFGINVSSEKIITDTEIEISVNHNSLFGPVISLNISNGKKILRLTPLTETDISEIFVEIGIIKNKFTGELLGRISQMIEEIPWLWELRISYSSIKELKINPDIKMSLKTGGVRRPEY